jgi:hypothetical protein
MAPPRVLAPLAVAGRVTLLVGPPKAGKSTTVAGVVAEASRAGVRCAIITLDEPIGDTLRRLVRFGAALMAIYVDDEVSENLTHELIDLDIHLVVVDHLHKIAEQDPDVSAGSQGDPVIWARIMSPFSDLARAHDFAVLLLDQSRRADGRWSGSAQKGGAVDIIAELQERDGALETVPRGRVPLPPLRIELDSDGKPQFLTLGAEQAPVVTQADERGRALLQLLADSEPEGLTSASWCKLSEIPRTTYHRLRRDILRRGLALSPGETRTARYRITDAGEASLVPEVPGGATGINGTPGGDGAIGTTPLRGVVPGTSPESGTLGNTLVPPAPVAPGTSLNRIGPPSGAGVPTCASGTNGTTGTAEHNLQREAARLGDAP